MIPFVSEVQQLWQVYLAGLQQAERGVEEGGATVLIIPHLMLFILRISPKMALATLL